MLFKYQGFDKLGNKVKSSIEAKDLIEAKIKIKLKGIIYTSIKEQSFSSEKLLFLKKRYKINNMVLSSISRDLSIYLNSGISLLSAMKLISQRYKKDKKLNPFFESIVTLLDEGNDLFMALELQTVVILPPFYIQSIKVSENGGILQTVLIELSDYLKEQSKINKQITSAMAYPIFILFVSFFMVAFMLSFIVPKITAIFEQYDQKLPPITEIVINAGDFVNDYYQVLIITFFFIVTSFMVLLKKSYIFKYGIDKIMLKTPLVGSLIELNELSRFSYMNSILIKSGVPVVQSFKLGANILKNEVLKKLFVEASSKVVEGEKLSAILDKSKVASIDDSFIQAIAIGEETSQLSEILDNLSQLYSQKSKDKIDIFLSLLEPIFMLVVGAIIGVIVVAMLLPIFSMSFQ